MKKGDKMKKIKAILSIILVFAIGIGGSGCMSAGKDLYKNQSEIQAEKAEEMLKEKYGKEFVVDSLGGRWGTATDATYTCICHPADDENLSFKAIVSKEYSFMRDGYATKIGELNFEKYLIGELKNITEDSRVLVDSGNQTLSSEDTDMSVEDFIDLNNNSIIYIKIIVDEKADVQNAVDRITEVLSDYDTLNSLVIIYSANDDVITKYDNWRLKSNEYDNECQEILENCSMEKLNIENGIVQ